ncbi:MAG: hypothetical protein ACYCOX_06710, partial [Acidobacteriaceae bacterium]
NTCRAAIGNRKQEGIQKQKQLAQRVNSIGQSPLCVQTMHYLGISVGSDLLLVMLELFPFYVALVVIFDEYLPVVERLAMAIAPVRSPILDWRPHKAFF